MRQDDWDGPDMDIYEEHEDLNHWDTHCGSCPYKKACRGESEEEGPTGVPECFGEYAAGSERCKQCAYDQECDPDFPAEGD